MRSFTLMLLLCSSGCFESPNETPLGRVEDAGSPAGGTAMTGGGAAGGQSAGGAAGGGSVGGGAAGAPVLNFIDAGVIASAGAPPALCSQFGVLYDELFKRVPTDAGCGNGCLWEVREQGVTLLHRGANPSTANDDLHWFDVSTGRDWHVFTVYRSQVPGSKKLVAVPTGGGSLETLETLPDSVNVTVKGVWFQASFFYALTLAPPQAGATGTTTFKRWSPANTPRLTQLSTLPSPPLFEPGISSFTGHYVVALRDGVYQGSMNTPEPVANIVGSSAIMAIVVGDTGTTFFAEKVGQTTNLVSVSLGGATPLVTSLGTGLDIKNLANDGNADELGALTNDGVYVITPSTRTAQLIYRGGPFIQGYQRLRGLVAESGTYAVGEICLLDADAPDWGTVKLTKPSPPGAVPVSSGSAMWVTGSAEWPWRTAVVDWSSAGGNASTQRTARGGFVIKTVGN